MNAKTGCLVLLLCAAGLFAQDNYAQWLYYKTIRINTKASGANINGNVTGYPLLVRLSAADSISGALSTGADIRFTKADGVTRLKHQIERWDTTTKSAVIWVLADTIYGGDSLQSIRMYWGKNNAADSSSGSSVFPTSRGFLGVWHMAEATGNVNDATGNGYTGNNTGTTTAAGSIGQGRAFNGINQWMGGANTANSTAWDVNLSNNITVSAWFNAINWTGNARILQRGQTAQKWALRDTTIGGISYLLWSAQGAAATGPRIAVSALAAGWHLVHGTANGTLIKLYMDGAMVDSVSASSAFTASTTDFGIGAVSSPANYFSGTLDEVRVHNTARDSNWIRLDYETQKTTVVAINIGATVTQTAVIPSVITHPVNQSIFAGATAKFSVVAGGTTPLTYKWVKNNTDTIVGATSDTLTLTNVLIADNASTYKVVVRNSAGQAVSNAATLTVTAPVIPSITVPPVNQTIILGGSVKFFVVATGSAPFTYKWVHVHGAISDTITTATTDTLRITTTTLADTGSYRVVVRNAAGQAVSASATLTVNPVSIWLPGAKGTLKIWTSGSLLQLQLPEGISGADVSIVNLRGRALWKGIVDARSSQVSLGSFLDPGLYILRLALQGNNRSLQYVESKIVLTP